MEITFFEIVDLDIVFIWKMLHIVLQILGFQVLESNVAG